jgi:DegV family protein with EDD domain
LNAYRIAAKKAGSILVITVSTKLSMTHHSAVDATELAKTELPDITIQVIDSHTATPSEGMVALAAARAADEGKGLPEVLRVAEMVREKVSAIIYLDTIQHVYRSGRIPKVASQIGKILHIKPILTVSRVVRFAGMVRNRKQGIERVLQMMRNKVGDKPVHVSVTHAYALDEAEKLMKRVSAEFNCIEVWLSEFSPVMGYACGTGTVGVAFYPED